MILFTIAALAAADLVPPAVSISSPPPVIQTASPPVPPPPEPSAYLNRIAQPKTRPATWVTFDDYPSEPLRLRQEGVVGFRLTIDPLGRASQCVITSSSTYPALDATTCTHLLRRARFTPAIGSNGEAIVGSYASSVRWTLPVELPAIPVELVPIGSPGNWATDLDYPRAAARLKQEGDVGFTLRLGTSGRPIGCTIVSSSTFTELDNHTCKLMMARARFKLAEFDPGQLDGATWTSIVHWKRPTR